MTIRLLAPRDFLGEQIPAGAVVNVFDAVTEAALIAAKVAASSAAAVTWTPRNRAYKPSTPVFWNTATQQLEAQNEAGIQSPVSGAGNFTAGNSVGRVICGWSSTVGTLASTTVPGDASVALDGTVLGPDGKSTLKTTIGATTGALIWDYTFATPVSLARFDTLQVPIRFSKSATFSGVNALSVELSDTVSPVAAVRRWRLTNGAVLGGSRLRSGVWHTPSMRPGAASSGWQFSGSTPPTDTASMDSYTIARIRASMTIPAGASGEAVWLGSIVADARRQAALTIRLDGNYASQHYYILPMLEAQGLRASLAISVSTIGGVGRMTAAQLDRAYAAGHEIILRCFDDTKFANGYSDAGNFADAAAIAADIRAGWDYMVGRGWKRGIGYLGHGGTVHPWAGTVSFARQAVLAQAFAAAGVTAACSVDHNEPGNLRRCQSVARVSGVDPFTVLGALQWASTTTAADLSDVGTRAALGGEWAIITGHESVGSGAAGLQVLNSDLATAVLSWATQVRSGALVCMPFGEACRYYGISA